MSKRKISLDIKSLVQAGSGEPGQTQTGQRRGEERLAAWDTETTGVTSVRHPGQLADIDFLVRQKYRFEKSKINSF